ERVIAASAAPVANTGNTTENTLVTVSVPGNILGPNGFIEVWTMWTTTGNTNTKTMKVKYSTAVLNTLTHNTAVQTTAAPVGRMQNRNATNSQISTVNQTVGVTGFVGGSFNTSAIDTTAAQNITLTAQCVTSGTDTITLEAYVVKAVYMP
ncbi:MAG: hypothetical protein KGP14_02405, partial [Betaproteobacteria bacterium]|nr:hypothetical protein [Betaproteobacteria bacterium]